MGLVLKGEDVTEEGNEKSELVYISDIHIDESNVTVSYELVNEKTVEKIDVENDIEEISVNFNGGSTGLVADKYVDRFFSFTDGVDISENGFLNAKSDGNNTLARKLRAKVQLFNQRNKRKATQLSLEDTSEDSIGTLSRPRKWYVCIYNVGNGESNLLISPDGKLYLFDGGRLNQDVSTKINLTINHFKAKNIAIDDVISGFFISHNDGDHFRGVIEAMERCNTSTDCFVYYNYLSSYPKPSWVNALARIDKLVIGGKLSKFVYIPNHSNLNLLKGLIPSLNIKWMWPFTSTTGSHCVSYGISSNDSSHCLYISEGNTGHTINFFGDAEKLAGRYIDINEKDLSNEFIFKPSHHGRKSGDIKVKSGLSTTINAEFASYAKVKDVISSTKSNPHLSVTARNNKLTDQVVNAWLVEFDGDKTTVSSF